MKVKEINPLIIPESPVTRVAVYARVSSGKDASEQSLVAQVSYYRNLVANTPGWELAEIFAEEGISGTKDSRPEFQRLLRACKEGKIDLVITKSVTRLARNTVTLLDTTRMLKQMGIDVYFEKERLHTLSSQGELILTLIAMYAEEEARSASENQKWKIRRAFREGRLCGNKPPYGYERIGEDFIIIPEEAEIVKRIFREFLAGKSRHAIMKGLLTDGIPSSTGIRWPRNSITDILRNDAYTGDLTLQKTYRENFRTKRKLDNNGELAKYYVKDHHPAIIAREDYLKAQELLDQVCKNWAQQPNRRKARKSLFSGLIVCGNCGGAYVYHHSTKYPPYYICDRSNNLGIAYCRAQRLPEDILIRKIAEILSLPEDKIIRSTLETNIEKITVTSWNHFKCKLSDGRTVRASWKPKSRSHAWTEEMRQAARNRALNYLEKKRKEELHE